jgi:thiamine biosynthesis lipoprotein
MVLTQDNVKTRTESSVRFEHSNGIYRLSFTAMATHCQVAFAEPSPKSAAHFAETLVSWVTEFESRYSRFLPSSIIGNINARAGEGWISIDPETETLFRLCDELHFLTEQSLDPSSLPFTRLWNWKAPDPVIPNQAVIDHARALVGWNKIQRTPGAVFLPNEGMGIDLGGMGKEYAVDQAAQLAHEMGIESILIDFGQDIRALGAPPGRPAWHIGLESPRKPGTCDKGLGIRNVAVASSGNYRRFFRKNGKTYGHIIDPRTGIPVENDVQSVTVVSPNCVLSGALTTASVILGAEAGLALIERTYNAEGFIRTQNQTFETKGFASYVVQ